MAELCEVESGEAADAGGGARDEDDLRHGLFLR